MAGLDITALLTGGNMEGLYNNQDPFYNAGKAISQSQFAAPTNNTEAFLLPFLQQSLGGALGGYGRYNANQTAYSDISKMLGGMSYPGAVTSSVNDLGETVETPMYGQETAPEGWSSKVGIQDLLLANAAQNAQIEAKAKKAEALSLLDSDMAKAKAEYERQVAQGTAQGKAAGEGGFNNSDIKGDLGIKSSVDESLAYVDSVIEQAKKANDKGKGALGKFSGMVGLPTKEKETLDGIGWSMVGQLDKIQGRETNSDVRKGYVQQFGPQWYDSDAEIERKGQAWKEFLKSAAKSTPALDSAVSKLEPTSQAVKAPLTQAQALAIAKQRGLIK
jgi:hypothetical protein